MSKIVNILGVDFNSVTIEEAVELINKTVDAKKQGLIVTPNVDHIIQLKKNHDFSNFYNEAILKFADGMPIIWLSKLISSPLPERVSGSDLFEPTVIRLLREKKKIFFVGGMSGAADESKYKFKTIAGDIVEDLICCVCPDYGFHENDSENEKIIYKINEFKPDLIILGLGTPKQEQWAYMNFNRLPLCPFLCIGASFDFYSKQTCRSPIFLQKIGLEWFFRLLQEPLRLGPRYLNNIFSFAPLFFKELIKSFFKNVRH